MFVSPVFDAALAGVFGLAVGSFLNVVVYRLPKMMYRDWLRTYPMSDPGQIARLEQAMTKLGF